MNTSKEFDILSHKVRLRDNESSTTDAQKVVDLLNKEITAISSMNSRLEPNKKILLAALKIAGDHVRLKDECKQQMVSFENSISEAMTLIDKFKIVEESPSTLN